MELQIIHSKIHTIRGQRVMLDFDLAELYDVENRTLKQAVRRNMERFPDDFMFELTRDEYNSLRSQIVTLETGRGKYAKYAPFAFTEHGVAMLSGVLSSPKAVEINIAIIRVFIALRRYALTYDELAAKLAEHDKGLSDIHQLLKILVEENKTRIAEIDALDTALDTLLDRFPAMPPPNEPRAPIGFKKD